VPETQPNSRFADWYSNPKNRNSLNKRRRRNYKKNQEYRKKVLAASRKWRRKEAIRRKKLPPKPKTQFSIGDVAEEIGCEQKTIRTLEKQGLIPLGNNDAGRSHRRYSRKQIDLILAIVTHRKAMHYRHPEYTPKLKALSLAAWKGW
jgi:hypothetical protein